MSNTVCRWGILGTAGIARKNWHSVLNSGNGALIAVGSRDVQRADQFIRECQGVVPHPSVPRACTYEALIEDPAIDALYIPLPTALRKPWVLRAAQAGKHILCEKPCGVSGDDVAEMLAACAQHRVQFMDGVMFLHSRRLEKLREVLQDGSSVGQLRRIASQFSFGADEEFLQKNIRASSQLEPLGCLGDLGWYNIRFTLWVMNHQRPERVSGRLLSVHPGAAGDAPVPLEFAGELFFAGGVSASFYCSFVTELQQWADISGSKGHVTLRDFVLPYYGSELAFDICQDRFAVTGCQFNMEEHTRRVAIAEYSNNSPAAQESNLFRRFGAQVLSGQIDPSWGDAILLTQQVIDGCLASARQEGRILAL